MENVPEPQGPRDVEVPSPFLAVPHPCPSGKLGGVPPGHVGFAAELWCTLSVPGAGPCIPSGSVAATPFAVASHVCLFARVLDGP